MLSMACGIAKLLWAGRLRSPPRRRASGRGEHLLRLGIPVASGRPRAGSLPLQLPSWSAPVIVTRVRHAAVAGREGAKFVSPSFASKAASRHLHLGGQLAPGRGLPSCAGKQPQLAVQAWRRLTPELSRR